MTNAEDATQSRDTRSILIEETFPHPPEVIWKALTDGALIAKWLGMTPTDFTPVVGNRFTYRTSPGGAWDGLIQCKVLEVSPPTRFVYSWKGGHPKNTGYGAPLDTIVTFTLTPVAEGTRVRFEHAGFVIPRNDGAYRNMSEGWRGCVVRIGGVVGEDR